MPQLMLSVKVYNAGKKHRDILGELTELLDLGPEYRYGRMNLLAFSIKPVGRRSGPIVNQLCRRALSKGTYLVLPSFRPPS